MKNTINATTVELFEEEDALLAKLNKWNQRKSRFTREARANTQHMLTNIKGELDRRDEAGKITSQDWDTYRAIHGIDH